MSDGPSLRVLIVDDEPAARRRLSIMLDELDVEVVGEAKNGIEALELVGDRRPDVLLLDIAMPEVDGFDVVRHLGENKPLIIFQTAYDEYALKAFEHEAIDYVVKPVTLDRLQRALERARARLGGSNAVSTEVLDELRRAISHESTVRRMRLLVRDGGEHRLLDMRDVARFVAEDGTVQAETRGKRFTTDYTLAELEQRTGHSFVRPNRSELVNLDYIETVSSNGDGSASLTLIGGTRVHVSRRRAADVKHALTA